MLKKVAEHTTKKLSKKALKWIVAILLSNIMFLAISIVGVAVIASAWGWIAVASENLGNDEKDEEYGELFKGSPLAPPYTITSEYIMHYGVDMSAFYGAKVMAVLDGEVVAVNMMCSVGDYSCGGSYGNYVMLKHILEDGTELFTMYGHMDNSWVYVTEGQIVEKGLVIGLQGNSGKSSGTHVHFETRVAQSDAYEYRRNPREYFEF